MSAQDFGVVAIVVPNPQYDPSNQAQIIDNSFGFALRGAGLISTLSPNNPNHYGTIQGLLYAPDLPASSPCGDSTRALIPANVTTKAQLPPGVLPLIALAPWTEPACVQSYLSVMRADQVQGAIFFHPDNSSAQPPPVSDSSWTLHDGGEWKSANGFPVYAIPGMLGPFLLNELAAYSGNMTEVPYGNELVGMYNPHDSVRLLARVALESTAGIPSLWVFLIIVLAILLVVVLLTSTFMHMLQRRQRRILQRRVANGEIDLEMLGIKRMQVPQELLDKMPQYTYTTQPDSDSNADVTDKAVQSHAADVVKPATAEVKDGESAISPAVPVHHVAFSQSTCPICLDDFINGETSVRELPCNHIFHPECIDPFLRDNSSLCPLCKKSSLPKGYCPLQVTNLMVRRERLMRRMQQRGVSHSSIAFHLRRLPAPGAVRGMVIRGVPVPMPVPRISVQVSPEQESNATSEMYAVPVTRRRTMTEEEVPAEVRAQGASARRAWLRERLARRQVRDYEQRADEGRVAEASRPLWRRAAGRVFSSL